MAELQQLLFPWRTSYFVTPPRTRPLTKTQDLHNLIITKAFRIRLTMYKFDVLKSLGGSCYSVNMSLPVASRGAMTITEYSHVDLFSQDSYQTCEVWCRSDIACLSYNNFLFLGEASKFGRPPRHALQ